MCGITGVFDSNQKALIDEAVVTSMANELIHRGPDELSVFIEGSLGFGFRRLSIVDLLHGHQPFFNEDNSVVLICNGEIYNHKELRAELETKGYRFKTNCDVEVLVHMYTEYGAAFFSRLNGQFAFAIFDKRDNSLLLARDHFGICPLFYTSFDGLFVFGSEIKSIIRHPLVKREVDMEGLDQVFTFPGPVSPVTLFKNISSLLPGHYMVVKNGEITITEYWDLVYPAVGEEVAKPESFYVDNLEDLLLKSVNYRLNGDVPVGFYLSGGLDSSLIGALMKALTPEKEYPSFSIGFPSDKDMNERVYQQQMISHLNLKNTQIMFDSSEVEKRLKQAVWSSECALKESYNTCSLALSEAVKNQGIKVILSGEGSDEFFGGYVGYRFDKQREGSGSGIKDLEEQLEEDYRMKLWGDPDFFYEKNYYEFTELKKNLYSDKVKEKFSKFNSVEKLVFNKARISKTHLLHKRSYVDLKLRLSDHLISDHCDRVTYANSVEGRFPFLDVNLVEFVKTIPPDLKLNGLVEKYILKKVAAKYIPETIINRQKFGFIAPGSPSIIRKDIQWINDLLSYDKIKKQGYFNPDVVEYLKKRYIREDFKLNLPFDSDLLIVVLTFNIFLEIFEMPDLS
jgi:asparagine synthase (glutamine-hydrolysing)